MKLTFRYDYQENKWIFRSYPGGIIQVPPGWDPIQFTEHLRKYHMYHSYKVALLTGQEVS